MKKSGRVLYAFSRFYLSFYGLDPKFLFDNYHIFGCLSARVYHVDERIESGIDPRKVFPFLAAFAAYLEGEIGPDPAISQLFNDERNYYLFEGAVLRKKAYSLDDLRLVTSIRSFDFRLMHRALVRLLRQDYDERIFAWFRAFEALMEVEDDLLSWREDMRKRTMNIYGLAKRLDPHQANNFVKKYRLCIERELKQRMEELPKPQCKRCEHILRFYRAIVPRPKVPH